MRSSPLVKRQDGGQLFPSCPLPSSPFFSLLLPFPSVPIFLNCVPLSPLYFNQISTGDKLNPIKQDIKKGKVCTCTHAQCRNTRFATQPFSATTKLTSGLFMLLLFFPAPRTRVFCSPVLCTTASHTMVTSGTMAPFLRYAQFPFFAGLLHHGAFVAFCSSNSAFWSPHTHTHTLSLSLSLYLLLQTWENPDAKDDHTGENGDNDPIDICDLSDKVCTCATKVFFLALPLCPTSLCVFCYFDHTFCRLQKLARSGRSRFLVSWP